MLFCDKHIALYNALIQGLFNQTVLFGKIHDNKVYVISIDTVHFVTNEFYKNPITDWFDFNSGCPRVLCIAINHNASTFSIFIPLFATLNPIFVFFNFYISELIAHYFNLR